MLWSLLKIVLFIAIVTAAAFGVIYIMDQDGGLTVSLGGREYPFTPVEVLILFVVAMVAFLIALKLTGLLIATLKFLTGDETAISRYFDRNRERRGFSALTDAMMMLASGDGKTALTKAKKAEKLLNRPELTRLVHAQAAEEAGDRADAEAQYKAMLSDNRTRFVGVHGLMRQRLASGDTETALKLAEKAFALKPKHSGLQATLFNLQTEQGVWEGARRTLGAQVKAAALPRDVATRRDAVLSLAAAQTALAAGDVEAAKNDAVEANRLAPTLVPAATTVAEVHMRSGSPRAASKAITKAWKTAPHPDLAAAFAALEPDETTAKRRKRFDGLLKLHPENSETKLLGAELAIADEDFPAARRAIGDLATTSPTTRSLAIMAAIERGEGATDGVVRGWLTKALTAPRGPQWTCTTCRTRHGKWEAVCDTCDSFDTVDWVDFPEQAATQTAAAAMLPVITGMLDVEKAEDTPAAPTDAEVSEAETIVDVTDIEAAAKLNTPNK